TAAVAAPLVTTVLVAAFVAATAAIVITGLRRGRLVGFFGRLLGAVAALVAAGLLGSIVTLVATALLRAIIALVAVGSLRPIAVFIALSFLGAIIILIAVGFLGAFIVLVAVDFLRPFIVLIAVGFLRAIDPIVLRVDLHAGHDNGPVVFALQLDGDRVA